jgi:hypothetical protein
MHQLGRSSTEQEQAPIHTNLKEAPQKLANLRAELGSDHQELQDVPK